MKSFIEPTKIKIGSVGELEITVQGTPGGDLWTVIHLTAFSGEGWGQEAELWLSTSEAEELIAAIKKANRKVKKDMDDANEEPEHTTQYK